MSVSNERCCVVKKGDGFTVLKNKIIQGLHNYEAIGFYCYITSLPSNWIFYKSHLMKYGNIGRDKIYKILKLLKKCNLIDIKQQRSADGKFMTTQFIIEEDDSKFIPFDENEINNELNVDKSEPFTEKPYTENQFLENSSYKINTNKINKKTKSELDEKTKTSQTPPPLQSHPPRINKQQTAYASVESQSNSYKEYREEKPRDVCLTNEQKLERHKMFLKCGMKRAANQLLTSMSTETGENLYDGSQVQTYNHTTRLEKEAYDEVGISQIVAKRVNNPQQMCYVR